MLATIPVWLVEVRTGDDEWIAYAPVWFGLDAARNAAQHRRDMGDTVRISEGRLTRLGTVDE